MHKNLQGLLNILNKGNYKKTAAADLFLIINIFKGMFRYVIFSLYTAIIQQTEKYLKSQIADSQVCDV